MSRTATATATRAGSTFKLSTIATSVVLGLAALGAQAQQIKYEYSAKGLKGATIQIPGDLSLDMNGKSPPVINAGPYLLGFEGISQYDGALFGRNFIPPDTMGAVGTTQYMSTSNGSYAVFDKAGNKLEHLSDTNWWLTKTGISGANGDSRVMFNPQANRWIAISFGASTADIQIAVSDTADALGTWKGTKFTGFAGGIADYPTLSMDATSVMIGTNNFKAGCNPSNPASTSFCGTTMNVIPLNSLFSAAPSTAGMKQFVTPYTYQGFPTDADRGFAQQGVNSRTGSGRIIANSLFFDDNVSIQISGLNANSSAGGTMGATSHLGVAAMTNAGPGRQPSAAVAANRRVIDTLDQRISASVYEHAGKIYMVQTVNSLVNGDSDGDFARVRYTVIDANTNGILSQGDIGTGSFDYYQGSIAVNDAGQVVIAYNRSGNQTADLDGDGLSDGNISFMAQTFWAGADGRLTSTSAEMMLKVSLTDDYHNGSVFGAAAAGRQRWGDYSAVSIDPNDGTFWAIGEFAREYNLPQFGHPGGTGGSRWGTWIAHISAPVPEPSTYALMALGLAGVGFVARRRRSAQA